MLRRTHEQMRRTRLPDGIDGVLDNNRKHDSYQHPLAASIHSSSYVKPPLLIQITPIFNQLSHASKTKALMKLIPVMVDPCHNMTSSHAPKPTKTKTY